VKKDLREIFSLTSASRARRTKSLASRKLGSAQMMRDADREKINEELVRRGLDGNGRFEKPGYAHAVAGEVLERHGYELTDHLSGWHTSREQNTLNLSVSRKTSDPFSPVTVENTALFFQYAKMPGGKYEVVSYLG